ncbi:MAG: hypothetical protein PHV74_04815 [Dehalococcoidia bacterium]|nr:hypothetical protein [Dehalococcoidia bacterium]
MDYELYERVDSFSNVKCPDCGEDLALEIRLEKTHKRLNVWQEGLCTNCGNGAFFPLLEATVVLDETSSLILAN